MSGDRAQINFDFAVGVSLLAISMIVALTMVPSLFGGVTEGQMQGDQVAADRIASNLVEGGLGDASRPNELDAVCARALFESDGFCGFDRADVAENVGVSDRNVNVEILAPDADITDAEDERLCWDDSDDDVARADCGDAGDVGFVGGGNYESATELASATRVATVGDFDARIIVRVW